MSAWRTTWDETSVGEAALPRELRAFIRSRISNYSTAAGRSAALLRAAAVLITLLWLSEPAHAAEQTRSLNDPLHGAGLAPIDWVIIAIYGAGTIGLGWYYGRQQTSTQEYFVGSGRMNPILIGVSLFATLLSTISYLSMPGEALGKGPVNMLN